ncbi:CBM35 domain-containing protein [Streptomyces sp. CA-288835]|uniref:CBM35 domain-containing protein n=1 Tax=Streptomyces sp. CA-288835 TaxID=3240069 RepID=UPI003D89BF73
MTPGNNGASTPEDDDPFGYLYADGQAAGATPPDGGVGYGYPGSVNRVRAVGERQYGQQAQQASQTAPTAQYAQAPAPQGQDTYGQSHYQAPETFGGGTPTTRTPLPGSGMGGGGGGRGRGPNTKGLLIGAIAVVAAVVIGIGVAMMGGDEDPGGNEAGGSTPPAGQNTEPSAPASKPAKDEAELPKIDAKTLRLEGGTTVDTQFKGAEAGGGVYVTGFNKVGAKVVWAVKGIEKAGTYRLDVRYGIPGVDANATVVVNGKPNTSPLNMENFIGEKRAPKGDWEKGWQTTWAPVNLTKGSNVIEIACAEGNQCDAVLDQLSLSKG